jgi:predicted Holliday junction resolvase-like endonuclease
MLYIVYIAIALFILLKVIEVQALKADVEIRDQAIDNLIIESDLEDIRRVDNFVQEIADYKKAEAISRAGKNSACYNLGDRVPYRLLKYCGEPK